MDNMQLRRLVVKKSYRPNTPKIILALQLILCSNKTEDNDTDAANTTENVLRLTDKKG